MQNVKIKVFHSINTPRLEKEVNDFIPTNNIDIIDIKFSTYERYFDCLVIYKEI